MVFNFYINSGPTDEPEPKHSEALEEIFSKMEIHFADWEDFYQYYMKTAKPPEKNVKRIQQLFNDLRQDFIEVLQAYNKQIRHIADIQEQDNTDTESEFDAALIQYFKSQGNTKSKEPSDDKNMNMYG
tara:strand:+ start:46 stop:429 length:384 start_codon:yes stop_codon:yes gene_type:complete